METPLSFILSQKYDFMIRFHMIKTIYFPRYANRQ
jgi:hypothetical protein